MLDHRIDAQQAAETRREQRARAKRQRIDRAKRELAAARERWRKAETKVMQLQADGASVRRIEKAKARRRELAREVVAARSALTDARAGTGARR